MISLTHFVFGLSLAYFLDKRLITASGFALVPDIDKAFNFLNPFVSQGIMHSFFAAGVFSFLVYVYTEDRASAESCFLGYAGSGLGLDLLTSSGFPIFFPLLNSFTFSLASEQGIASNLAVLTFSISLIIIKKYNLVSIDIPDKL